MNSKKITTNLGLLVTDYDGKDIKQLIIDHKVVIVRDSDVSARQLIESIGPLLDHPFLPKSKEYDQNSFWKHDGSYTAVYNKDYIAIDTDIWHQDFSWFKNIPAFEAIEYHYGPSVGDDILFACREKAFEMLSPELQETLINNVFQHAPPWSKKRMRRWLLSAGYTKSETIEKLSKVWTPDNDIEELKTFHPGAIKSPYNGKWLMNLMPAFATQVNPHIDIIGMSSVFNSPHINMRWKYEPGDIVLWHNHLVAHYALQDYYYNDPNRSFSRYTTQ